MRTGAVVQARMGSTRLPGKVLLDLCGKPVIDHVVERLRQCRGLDEIIIATTDASQDDVLARRAEAIGASCFRGSEEDVLSRYYHAARGAGLDVVVRVTSDCPLIDPQVTDEVIRYFHAHDYTMVSNGGDEAGERTYPRGLDTEVFSFGALREAFELATSSFEREHVSPHIYEHGTVHYYKNATDYSRYRWTLDTADDYALIRTIYERLYRGKHDFYFMDIVRLMEREPGLAALNAHVEQKIYGTTGG
jgi:spore coat polysaccharide biosynthesis protein SpsF